MVIKLALVTIKNGKPILILNITFTSQSSELNNQLRNEIVYSRPTCLLIKNWQLRRAAININRGEWGWSYQGRIHTRDQH